MKKLFMSEIDFSAVKEMREDEMYVLVGGKGGTTVLKTILDIITSGANLGCNDGCNGNCGCNKQENGAK